MKDILDFFKSIAIIPLSICFYFVRINFVIIRQVIKIQPDFIKRLIRFCINKSIISFLSLLYYPLKYFYLIMNLLLIMLSYIKAIPIISNIVKILKNHIPRVDPFVD